MDYALNCKPYANKFHSKSYLVLEDYPSGGRISRTPWSLIKLPRRFTQNLHRLRPTVKLTNVPDSSVGILMWDQNHLKVDSISFPTNTNGPRNSF
uniref:Uncharacterized protein n=1 Tax=Oryza sativa subsp. japonica TaxID=39947 RepID=Q2R4V8_ORYSJ|nr:hypothetical protein LOC_Os11g27140 [Oryza sativa Japonica Group]